MGNARPRPALLHKKIIAVREYLGVSQQTMAELLKLPHAGRVSEYECDLREPNLMVVLAYSCFGKVHMEWIVDDQIGIDAFREQLGTVKRKRRAKPSEETSQSVEPQQSEAQESQSVEPQQSQADSEIQSKQRPKPVTLIHGTR